MQPLSQEAIEQLFLNARTFNSWLNTPVQEETLRAIFDLMKFGPTSANSEPARFLFVRTKEAKEKLVACLSEGNRAKTLAAPVTAVIAQDMAFYEQLPRLMPHTDARSWFAGNEALIEVTALRNSSLQGAYFILAARALGLDCGPMSGFDNARVDATFFAGTTWRANFICNLGYGDPQSLFPRLPRLAFEEACKLV